MITKAAFVVLGGWFAGGMINYFADQLPRKGQLTRPVYPPCLAPLQLYRWLVQKRTLSRGSAGASRRIRRHIVVELAAILLLAGLRLTLVSGMQFWLLVLLISCFGLIMVIDLEHKLILNAVVAPTVTAALSYGTLGMHRGWTETVGGGIAGYGLMYLMFLAGKMFVRISEQRNDTVIIGTALGDGDIILAGIIGLAAGWPGVLAALMYGVCAAGFGALIMRLRRDYHSFTVMPYGLFLVSGAATFLWLQASA